MDTPGRFFWVFLKEASYKASMSETSRSEEQAAGETKAAVRLRVPERRQVAMVVQCPDDLVPAGHPVRMVMGLVERLDLVAFFRAHQGARGSGGTGRDRSAVAGGVVVVRVYSGDRIGAGVGAAL